MLFKKIRLYLKGHFFAAMNASNSLKLECQVVEEYKMIAKRQRGFRWPWLAGVSFSFLWRVEAPCKMIFQVDGMERGQRPLTVETLGLWCLRIRMDKGCKVLRECAGKDNWYNERASNALWQPSAFYKMLLSVFHFIPESCIAVETLRLRALT
jgi:hypothetical protein